MGVLKKLFCRGLRSNGDGEDPRSVALVRAASSVEIGLLSNHPERRRQIEARGASPLMRERRSNALMMHPIGGRLQEERQRQRARAPPFFLLPEQFPVNFGDALGRYLGAAVVG